MLIATVSTGGCNTLAKSANRLREAKKQENIRELELLLGRRK
jgi:hypothetical protein